MGIDVAWEHVIQPEGDTVAIVNGVSISTEEYLEELRRQLESVTASYDLNWYDEQTVSLLPTFQNGILQQMINEELSNQLAAATMNNSMNVRTRRRFFGGWFASMTDLKNSS